MSFALEDHLMRRRDLLRGATLLPLGTGVLGWLHEAVVPAMAQEATGTPFDGSTVRALARELAAKPYQPPPDKLPEPFSKLGYDQYRSIRFDRAHALWHGKGLPFEIQFFHRGFLYTDRVDLFEVAGGRAVPIRYSPELYSFGDLPRPTEDLGFAGFRIHAPINQPEIFDEVCAFLGASYFRAVAKNQGYGLSARGLAIKTADAAGEEFPVFKAFWMERPQPQTSSVVVHALLDGPSAAAAFRFTIRPGETTLMDVESTLYPRVDIAQAGIAPQTSMFYFAPNDRSKIDDFRPAVHDSDGLLVWNGRGEQLWRPLSNPAELQVSGFADVNPRGFGLMQRRRGFHDYEDLEARYERRPSLWVEPIGDYGEGAVNLVEIPTNREIHDNIVAFWRPAQPLRAKGEHTFNYRLHWGAHNPWSSDVAKVVATRIGAGSKDKSRLFVIDVAGEKLKSVPADAKLQAEIWADQGKIANAVAQPNPEIGGWRMSFELETGSARAIEMRVRLMNGETLLSEAWMYRWTP
jgi:glucans biosynthesis protein